MEPHRTTDEKELLIKLRDGDTMAFARIYREYSLTLHRILMKMVHCEQAADDLLQDVFLKIWKSRKNIDPDQSFKGYIFITAKFTALKYLRHISIEKQVENYFACSRSAHYRHVEENILFKESDLLLRQTIDKLPTQRRRVYTLCKIDGLSYDETARELGISPATVRDHIVKANHFLRKELAGTSLAPFLITIALQQIF